MLEDRNLFIADTYVNTNPTAEQLAEMTILAAEEVRRFGITPRVATFTLALVVINLIQALRKCVKFTAFLLNKLQNLNPPP